MADLNVLSGLETWPEGSEEIEVSSKPICQAESLSAGGSIGRIRMQTLILLLPLLDFEDFVGERC